MSNFRLGDKVILDAPVFRAGDKVTRDAATANQGKVCMGDCAPIFTAKK